MARIQIGLWDSAGAWESSVEVAYQGIAKKASVSQSFVVVASVSWKDDEHLETDYTKGALGIEVVSDLHDQRPTQRIFASPIYDQQGNLRCRSCGAPLARGTNSRGEGLASCSDTGCPSHGFEFLEGSFTANPARFRR